MDNDLMNITHSYFLVSYLRYLAIVRHYHLEMSWIEHYNSTIVVVSQSNIK